MRFQSILMSGLVAACFALAATACDDEKSVTCKGAMDNLYDAECAIFADGYQVSEEEAVEGCEDMQDDAKDEDCYGEFKDLLKCFDGIDDGDCEDCNGEWNDLYECMGWY